MKWSELLGPKLQTKEGLQDTDDRLTGKKVVGFYFCGHKLGPLDEHYTFYLKDLYQHTIMAYPEVEFIYVSSDSDLEQYNKYFELLKFPAVPFDERATIEALNTKFGFQAYPIMIFFNGEGKVITSDGLCRAVNVRGDGYFLWEGLMKMQYPDNYWEYTRSRYGRRWKK